MKKIKVENGGKKVRDMVDGNCENQD